MFFFFFLRKKTLILLRQNSLISLKYRLNVGWNQGSNYHTGTYIGIETSMFRTGLNTGNTGHVLAILVNFGQY